jgi:HD superfamily phosphohydrolase
MFYQLIKMDRKFKGIYSKEEIGFTLVAALAHDIGHRGVNNLYEIKMNTELARIAENDAVL